ncbi:MAG: hypothetical protein QGH12_10685, partial [SAR324 cluster bacterium]|nr:hypothetical protein [SAR324 cluster bacterium]
ASVEQPRGRGLTSNRFLGEWTYILGLGAGWCRGVGRGAGARVGRAEADPHLPKRLHSSGRDYGPCPEYLSVYLSVHFL